jgi:hypothetical protein
MNTARDFNPSKLSAEELQVMVFAMMGELQKQGVFVPKIVNATQAIELLPFGKDTFWKLVRSGTIIAHYPIPGGYPVFFMDEIYKKIKES